MASLGPQLAAVIGLEGVEQPLLDTSVAEQEDNLLEQDMVGKQLYS